MRRRLLISVLSLGFVSPVFSSEMPSAPVTVRFIGHASVLIDGPSGRVLTDPCWRDHILMGLKRAIPPAVSPEELPPLDVVLVSHTHPDHYDPDAMARLRSRPVIVMPWGRGAEMRKRGFTVVELRPGQQWARGNTVVTAVPARHMWGHCLGYVLRHDGKTFYFSGDTKLWSGLSDLRRENIDLMILGYGGFPLFGSTWTSPQAAQAVAQVHPKSFVPVHWGTFPRWWTKKEPETPKEFIELVRKAAPDIAGKFVKVGETIAVP